MNLYNFFNKAFGTIASSKDPVRSMSQKRASSKRVRGPDGKFLPSGKSKTKHDYTDKKIIAQDKEEDDREEENQKTDPVLINKLKHQRVHKSILSMLFKGLDEGVEDPMTEQDIIGQTEQGLPIYSDPFSTYHKDFSSEDFVRAAQQAGEISQQYEQMGDQENAMKFNAAANSFQELAGEAQPPFHRYAHLHDKLDELENLDQPVDTNQNTRSDFLGNPDNPVRNSPFPTNGATRREEPESDILDTMFQDEGPFTEEPIEEDYGNDVYYTDPYEEDMLPEEDLIGQWEQQMYNMDNNSTPEQKFAEEGQEEYEEDPNMDEEEYNYRKSVLDHLF